MIRQHEHRHGLDDRDCSRQDAGIMAAAAFEFGIFTRRGHRFLLAHDRRGGLEGDAENDIFTIGNPTLDTAGAVGGGADLAIDDAESVVVIAAGEQRPREARADLETLGRRDGEHGLGEVRFKLVEDRLTQTRRAIPNHALDDAADRIPIRTDRFDALDHRIDHRRIAGADHVGLDHLGGDCLWIDLRLEILDGFHPSKDFDAGVKTVQHLAGDGCCCDATDCLTGRGTTATRGGANAVFRIVGVVRMARAVFHSHFVVSAGALVGISNEDGNG